jgi:Domain of unknown function (DUF6391)
MQRQLSLLQPVLDLPYIRRTRRNHGLEHATIHLLSQRVANLRMVGRSDAGGFWLFGDVTTEDVHSCVEGALQRMQAGEHRLAIHPNCGTNLITVAAIGTLATLVALIGSERERFGKIQRIPLVATGLMIAAVLGQPLGAQVQEHITTLGDPGDLEILDIKRTLRGGLTAHRVRTTSS